MKRNPNGIARAALLKRTERQAKEIEALRGQVAAQIRPIALTSHPTRQVAEEADALRELVATLRREALALRELVDALYMDIRQQDAEIVSLRGRVRP